MVMKIGIDIDGVIYNTENAIRCKAELYDLLELHKNGVVNKEGFLEAERYDWTEEEIKKYRETNFIAITQEAVLMPGAKEVLGLLKKDGHELVIITARGGMIKEMKDAAEQKLKEDGVEVDQYYWTIENKLEVCQKEHIDIMIDDRAQVCSEIANNKIRALYFRDVNRKKLPETEYLKEVNNWGEIYRYIYNWNMEEK